MKHILVPTDFSKNSFHALQYAIFLFNKEPCTFYILHAYQTTTSSLESQRNKTRKTRLFQITKAEAENNLSRFFEKIILANENTQHTFKSLSIANSLLNAIGKSVIDYTIDYIVMGTKGATGLKSVFLGSNTVNVISKIDFCPIIAVPEDCSFDAIDEILFASGFEHICNKYELLPLINIAQLWDAKIKILHWIGKNPVDAHKQNAKEVISQRLKNVSYEVIEVEKKYKISTEIEQFVEKHEKVAMITMINYWHSFLQKLTSEQVVNNVAFNTKVPFLVMHLPE